MNLFVMINKKVLWEKVVFAGLLILAFAFAGCASGKTDIAENGIKQQIIDVDGADLSILELSDYALMYFESNEEFNAYYVSAFNDTGIKESYIIDGKEFFKIPAGSDLRLEITIEENVKTEPSFTEEKSKNTVKWTWSGTYDEDTVTIIRFPCPALEPGLKYRIEVFEDEISIHDMENNKEILSLKR